jgi:uracil-DNA glycosylase
MNWATIQQEVQSCRHCATQDVANLRVPGAAKRNPPWEPLRPVRLYFVSVAPPWGGDYFWDETNGDAVREGLFEALRSLPKPLAISSCREFRDARLFLTPAVKCPSSIANKDSKPSPAAIENCAHFLRSELIAAEAERILALGQVPFRALCRVLGLDAPSRVAEFRKQTRWVRLGQKNVPLMGTYFPGNNRHRGFASIVEDIERLLDLVPKLNDV